MRATGGILGGSPANGSATEHQGIGTPHVHGEIHIASVYQYKLLPEIAKLIEDDVLDPQSIMDFNTWYHTEEPPNQQLHDEMVEGIEKEWHARFSDRKHDDMSQVPGYIANDHAANMWSDKSVSKEKAQAEGVVFKKQYFEDAQKIFSRVQHHFHEKTKKGYKPLEACLSSRSKKLCKHDFPIEKRLNKKLCVVCRGNARKFKLRIKGKRNQLGMTLGRRAGVWQSGTMIALGVFNRSNSHTASNYRLPPIQEVHDDELCSKECFSRPAETKIISKLAQRAQREATGYYCGYTFKRQACGKFVLKATTECLNYVELGLKDNAAGRQWYRMCNRMITDLNHRCTMRTAPEEFKLSVNQHTHTIPLLLSLRGHTWPKRSQGAVS